MKKIIKVILKKLNKKIIISKSYKIILLLNYLRKIAEKIIATRLFFLIKLINLLNSNQIENKR